MSEVKQVADAVTEVADATTQIANTLNGAVASMIEKTLSGIDKGSEFIGGQLPEYINQLLMWYGVKSFIWSVVATILLIIGYKVTKKAATSLYNKDEDGKHTSDDDSMVYGTLFGGFGVIVYMLIVLNMFSLDWLQILIAPKVFLVDYMTQLVK